MVHLAPLAIPTDPAEALKSILQGFILVSGKVVLLGYVRQPTGL